MTPASCGIDGSAISSEAAHGHYARIAFGQVEVRADDVLRLSLAIAQASGRARSFAVATQVQRQYVESLIEKERRVARHFAAIGTAAVNQHDGAGCWWPAVIGRVYQPARHVIAIQRRHRDFVEVQRAVQPQVAAAVAPRCRQFSAADRKVLRCALPRRVQQLIARQPQPGGEEHRHGTGGQQGNLADAGHDVFTS
jgi:hypothetical protein